MNHFDYAKSIVKKLSDAGFIAYFAGGWVRDHLMKHPSDDIDIATSASVEEIQKLFPKTVPVGINFGIVIVVEGGHSFEVATFRKDLEYKDGRRPTGIDKADPREDAQRRDFTINGMFYSPLTEEIIDYVSGQEDIKKKVIRAIGNPHDRFKEDRLRMMRAVRYATRFCFDIDTSTRQAIQIHANEILPAVAIERIWQEFKKMSKFQHFDTAICLLFDLGLLQRIFPPLQNLSMNEIKKRVGHISSFPKETPPVAELLELFPDFSLEETEEFCEFFKLSNEEKKFALSLKHFSSIVFMPKSWQEKLELYEWAKFYADPHEQMCLAILSCKQSSSNDFEKEHADRKKMLKEFIRRIKEKDPIVTSSDLMKEGIKPGLQMGKILKEAERLSVNKLLHSKEKVLEKLKTSDIWKT